MGQISSIIARTDFSQLFLASSLHFYEKLRSYKKISKKTNVLSFLNRILTSFNVNYLAKSKNCCIFATENNKRYKISFIITQRSEKIEGFLKLS